MALPAVAVAAIPAVASLIGSIFGSKTAQKAQREASGVEERLADRAIEEARQEREYNRARDLEREGYDRGQYADFLNRVSPYSAAGAGAVNRLSQALGGQAVNVPNYMVARPGPVTVTPNQTPIQAATGQGWRGENTEPMRPMPGSTSGLETPMNAQGMESWRAPDGEIRQFPASMAAQLEAKGAVRVGAR